MVKVLYNAAYGGFWLDEKVMKKIAELKGMDEPDEHWMYGDIARHDKQLIEAIEFFYGDLNDANKTHDYAIRELKPGTQYRIEEYDGFESVIIASEHKWVTAE